MFRLFSFGPASPELINARLQISASERELETLKQNVRNLLNDVADRNHIYKAAQFNCPHMRILAETVFENGDVIR